MSARAPALVAPPSRGAWGRTRALVLAPLPALLAFAGLALYAGVDYARLETNPPFTRVLGVVLVATLGGWALALTTPLEPGALRRALRIGVVAVMAVFALRSSGVPYRLLWPGAWVQLGSWLTHGLGGLEGGLWPYRGADPHVRLVVLLGIPACVVPASALCFWPDPRRRQAGRRAWALVLLVGLYITALVNQPRGAWVLHGLMLLVLLAAWMWLERLARPGSARALAWLLACAVSAVLLALLVRAPAPWLAYRSWNPFGAALPPTSFQWDQLYGPIPWSRSREAMLDVSATAPQLWKVTTLDRFDGVGFLRSDDPPAPPLGRVPGGVGAFADVGFTVRGLHSRLLAGAGQVLRVNVTASEVTRRARVAPDGSPVLVPSALQPGDAYTVTTYVPHATPAELRRAPRALPAGYGPFAQFQLPPRAGTPPRATDLAAAALPRAGARRTIGPVALWNATVARSTLRRVNASPYASTFHLARRLAAGQANPYDVAQRIAGFLRRNYVYSEQPPVRTLPVPAFLFRDGVGYCQQFSAAMTLMLRMDGIPARVAEGFLPGSYDAKRRIYHVTALDAHAWVEVYFRGIGWWSFDPTPARRATAATPAVDRLRLSTLLAALNRSSSPTQVASPLRRREVSPRPPGGAPDAGRTPLLAIGLGLLAAAALMSTALLAVCSRRLRRGLRGQGDGAVAELTRALHRLGYGAPAQITLTQLAGRLEATHGAAAARYAERLAQRRYRPDAAGPSPTASDRRALRRALVSQGGPRRRLLGLLALPPAVSAARTHRGPAAE